MNSNGDYAGKFIGVGSESSPALAMGSEPSTGIYLETPGTASGLNFTKRGTKRLRIDDSGSTFYGPVNCGTGSSFSTITLSDGSQALPSLNFAGATTSGLSLDTSGTSTHLHTSISGVSKIRVQDDFINTNVPFHLPTGSTTQPALTFSSSSSCGLSFDTQGTSSHIHTSVAGISKTRVSEDLLFLTVPIETGTNAISGGPMDCSSLTSTGQILAPSDGGTVSLGMFGAPTQGIIFDSAGGDISFAPAGTPSVGFYADGTASFSNIVDAPNYVAELTEPNNGFSFNDIISGFSMTPGTVYCKVQGEQVLALKKVSDGGSTFSGFVQAPAIAAGGGSNSSPGYSFREDSKTGLEYTSSPSPTLIPVVNGVPVSALTQTSFRSLVPFDCGTQSLTCGSITGASISCSDVVATGTITSKRYEIYATNTSTQSCPAGITAIIWATITTNINWGTVIVPSPTIPIIVSGTYRFDFGTTFALNSTGERTIFLTVNAGGGHGCLSFKPVDTGDVTRCFSGCTIRVSAGDLITVNVYQTTSGALNIGGDTVGPTVLSIVRLSE